MESEMCRMFWPNIITGNNIFPLQIYYYQNKCCECYILNSQPVISTRGGLCTDGLQINI